MAKAILIHVDDSEFIYLRDQKGAKSWKEYLVSDKLNS